MAFIVNLFPSSESQENLYPVLERTRENFAVHRLKLQNCNSSF